jgi:hypothetical protein
VFENTETNKIQKRKKSHSDELSKQMSSGTEVKKEYSINEIVNMSIDELSSKVFTFEKSISKDLTKVTESNQLSKIIEAVIRGLQSMKGIDEEYLPKFKFF